MIALSDAGLSPEDLDAVLLVGGTTRIPLVRRFVEECLDITPKSAIDPDLAVARGAAIQAGIIDGLFTGEEELILTDVCPYTLGIAAMQDGFKEEHLTFSPIIPRNTTIPVERSKFYHTHSDNQTQALIQVYQGDSTVPENNDYLGEVRLYGIPPAKRGKEPLEIIFSYDMNGILQVKARVVSTNAQVSAEINTAGVKPKEKLDLNIWEQAEGAKKYRPVIRKAEKYIRESEAGSWELELIVTRLKEALLLGDEDRADEFKDELLELIDVLEGKL